MRKILLAIALGILLVCAAMLPFLFQSEPSKSENVFNEKETEEEEFVSQVVEVPMTKIQPLEHEVIYDPENNPILFRGNTITQMYSMDGDGYRYHPVVWEAAVKEAAQLLENYEPEYIPSQNMVGFLIFTDQEKYACYLDAEWMEMDAVYSQLVEISEGCNANAAGAVKWLVYMTPSNLSKVSFYGLCGNGYSVSKQPYLYEASATLTEREELEALSSLLKKMSVRPADQVYAKGTVSPENKSSLWTMTMEFSTGVTYTLFGYNTELYISSSDMQEQIHYTCNDLEISQLRDFMMNAKGTVLTNLDTTEAG